MEFKSLKNFESSFRHIRLFSMLFLGLCALVAVIAVLGSFRYAEKQREKIYVREHVRRFHELFFSLSPDKDAIEGNINRALLLADKSALSCYRDLQEAGYYNRLIAGNVIQRIAIDSMQCDFGSYPYRIKTFARQQIVRESVVTERSLITSCCLVDVSRSDNNPQGFLIERFTIVENKNLGTYDR